MMYERYTHTERTVVERGEYPLQTGAQIVCGLWSIMCLILTFAFGAMGAFFMAFIIGSLGMLGLLLQVLIGVMSKAQPSKLTEPLTTYRLLEEPTNDDDFWDKDDEDDAIPVRVALPVRNHEIVKRVR